jgi:hypothetical protein
MSSLINQLMLNCPDETFELRINATRTITLDMTHEETHRIYNWSVYHRAVQIGVYSPSRTTNAFLKENMINRLQRKL